MAQSPAHDAEFRRMYDEHFAEIRSYCLRRLPTADANDAVSEVFLVAWRKRNDIPETPLPWLYGVARNVIRNTSRATRRQSRITNRLAAEPTYPEPGTDVPVVRHEDDQAVLDALATLSAQDQEVLRLRAWEGLSASEVATVVGCSLAAAEKRLTRASKRLEAAIRTISPHAIGKETG